MNNDFPKPQVACSSLAGVTDGKRNKRQRRGTHWKVHILTSVLMSAMSACTIDATPIPRQAEVTDLVWRGAYGMTVDPPVIEWVRQEQLNCLYDQLNGAYRGFRHALTLGSPVTRECVTGTYWADENVAQVSLQDRGFSFADDLAHELWHARMKIVTGDADGAHKSAGFAPGGDVESINDVIRGMGL